MSTWIERACRIPLRLHRDQRGTLSIVSVFALLSFTMLMAMVINVARHADDKLRMQIAADAAAHSGGVVLARGMNGVAFGNHLLCDVFAMTAFLREGRDRTAEALTPRILQAWEITGNLLTGAEFDKFAKAAPSIRAKVTVEREAIRAFGEMTELASDLTLPVFEYILRERLIPQYQRELVIATPIFAQQITQEVARRHEGGEARERGPQLGRLWRTRGLLTGYPDEADPMQRTLPIVDPDPAGMDAGWLEDAMLYRVHSLRMRRRLAKYYLDRWNFEKLGVLFPAGKMSQFANLWRITTCGQLDRLLNLQYPLTNMPMMIRLESSGLQLAELLRAGDLAAYNAVLERDFMFIGTVHRGRLPETAPGVFRNPLEADALTFAQVFLFIPRSRWISYDPLAGGRRSGTPLGGTLGFDAEQDFDFEDWADVHEGNRTDWRLEGWPAGWDSFNQNWTVKLVPTTARSLPMILQSDPGGDGAGLRMPELGDADIDVIKQINTH